MSSLVYEFPLNEKCRNYLRLNELLQQTQHCRELAAPGQATALFKALLDIMELLERCDLRSDLAKDLEQQKGRLDAWAQVPGVDAAALARLGQQLEQLVQQLPRAARLGQQLREDKLLSAVRSRFAIPGGLCPFDVPQLHYWLNQPVAQQQRDLDGWLSHLQLLQQGLALLLTLWRETGQFRDEQANAGFFQDNAEQTEMIRLRLPVDTAAYPVVSGNKYRFTIRFMPIGSTETGHIDFELANIK
ncbi:cell division protein ZapD [Zobellella taiwanensis]|jgi:cell division protein ZapD|uniref:Cell division protein ZapD n=1 Tax=Zobellella taiwanensis TaxID=347535 RepID=A0A2P7R1W3_9GAMM|nr:cell division protein ZapD [Zobellella taiwanensis]PSJ44184.1 cell division protein ZapD [Zobellella taiwanensis]